MLIGEGGPRPYDQERQEQVSQPADLSGAVKRIESELNTEPDQEPKKKGILDKLFPYSEKRRKAVITGAVAAGTLAATGGLAAAAEKGLFEEAQTESSSENQNEESKYNELFNSPTTNMKVLPEGGAEEDAPSTIIGMRERAGWPKEYEGSFRKILRERNPEKVSDTYVIQPGVYEDVPINKNESEGKE